MWMQDKRDHFDWRRRSRRSSSFNTGLTGNYTTGKGIYADVSSASYLRHRRKATLVSKLLNFDRDRCISIAYQMKEKIWEA